VGAAFNIICLVMCFVFPAKARTASKVADADSSSTGGLFGCFKAGGATPITADITPNKDVESAAGSL
jgi:hypothetical protein